LPQLRQNIITDDWVVIAPERAKRPSDFITSGMVRRDHKDNCAFCVGSDAWHTRLHGVRNESDHIYVIPNKFPAFVGSSDQCERRSFSEETFYTSKPAVGGHEVLVIKDHDLLLPDFPQVVMVDLLAMLQHRYRWYRDIECRPEYTMGIYNFGQEAGASIWHPHAQLFASAIVPNLIMKEKQGAERYFESTGICVFCDLLAHERATKIRLQVQTKRFTSFTFYAARFPFELMILPNTHQSRFEDASLADIENLATVLRELLTRLQRTLNNPPLNIFIHSLPNTSSESDYYHWHIEIAPRLTTYGGFELGGSTIINVVSPENAAKFLRNEK
jgi:UDPglucose--hexose-1-phosphate uridylyltransferase